MLITHHSLSSYQTTPANTPADAKRILSNSIHLGVRSNPDSSLWSKL